LNLNGFIKIGKDSEYKFVHFLFAQEYPTFFVLTQRK